MRGETLDVGEVTRLAAGVCELCGAKAPPRERLLMLRCAKVPQPLVINGGLGRVWVDKYYLAYRLAGGKVRYVYITRRHICEELESIRELERERGMSFRLPREISAQFALALERMDKSGRMFALVGVPEQSRYNASARTCADVAHMLWALINDFTQPFATSQKSP